MDDRYEKVAVMFKMLADVTRLKIMGLLMQEELCVTDLANKLQMTHSAISHQLALLKHTRLVKSRKEGKVVYYSLNDEHVMQIYQMAITHIDHE